MATYAAADLRTRRSPVASSSGWAPSSAAHENNGFAAPTASAWQSAPSNDGWGSAATPAPAWASSAPGSSTWEQSSRDSSPGGTNGGNRISDMSLELRMQFLLILITAVCLHADQNLAAPNLSAIAEDFQMTPLQKDTRLGGMVQFGFFLIGGAVSLLVGPATDQVDRVSLLSVVVLSGCVPSFLMSIWVPSSKAGFFYFFLARICTGVAIGGSFPVLFSLSADVFPASQRPFVSACISAATNVGAAVGGLMSGVVGPRWGWRAPFRIVALPAFCCAALVRVLLVDPRSVRRAKLAKEDAAINNPAFSAWLGGKEETNPGYVRMEELDFGKFKRILHVRSNMLVFAQSLPGCIPLSCIVTFLSDYLAVEQGMKVQASTAITAIFGVSCLCFALGGGMLGQSLLTKHRQQLPLLMCAATCCAVVPFMILVNSPQTAVTTSEGRPTVLAMFLALLGGCAAVTGPNIRAVLMNVNDSEVRGTCFSCFTLTDDLGKGLGPSIIVAMTAIFGRRLAYTLAFSFWWLSGLILLGLRSSLPGDMSRHGDSFLPMKSK